ncbi:alpha-D-ribose 1-methylphosphonate 5-triphosphate diphosphatase [Puniceibacterium sp. IMCC21224]|uniref:alpha-D-ribose 1-methylphosphonate 5-triphosphate diphosphatase n=1 Tax=Puniceibacterium sp. IMCC21224 TaxID=1618204 RepID=UPI00064E073F|nr:alpha-D-ribose 1-methylphosphonate 5-triphosphate diphosphatase [Puniceibacterium sp. IMCC21224]KMK66629.1 metal-dependent hydrolase involved in phosphonate metabolism [Puniceibacterium sp. IMCC21224]
MIPSPLSLRLTGATSLRDGTLQNRSVAIKNGRISKGPLPEVDLSGYYILPGIIDLHGDACERHQMPRPNAAFSIESALRATDRDAAANGVTTAWITQGWSWEGGLRSPDHAEQFLRALDRYRAQALTDLRVQIRCETHTTDTADRLLAAVRRHRVKYVVFNNHIEQTLATAISSPDSLVNWARDTESSAAQMLDVIRRAQAQKRDVPRYLCRLAEAFDTLGVVYGSHDDPDGETRETFSMIGAKICEFPLRRGVAALARAVGDPVLMGAPNVVRGGSQAGHVAAIDLIRTRLCDVLVSDFYYPALLQAAFRLVDDNVLSLPQAWAMISATPAQILRLPDRGVIDYGLRADLVVVHKHTRAIEATISGGRITHLAGEAAQRFLGVRSEIALAAE